MSAGLVTAALDAERLAQLPLVHRSPGRRRRELVTSCSVPGCDRPAALLPRGWRCEQHRPAQPVAGYCAPGRCYCDAGSCERRP